MSYQSNNRTPDLSTQSRFYSAYSPKLSLPMVWDSPSPYTDQSFRDECDINTIMSRYQSTGEMPVLNQANANWLDVSGEDFQTHMNIVVEARQMFSQLPSDIRDRFGNSPQAFLSFTSDPLNLPELARMGLLTPEATERITSEQNRSQRVSAPSMDDED